MTDRFDSAKRSEIMSRVRGRDTKPEIFVRRALFKAGFRYRLHVADLPGRPDIVLPRYRIIVRVNGCLWHGHSCRRGRRPATNEEFWQAKIDGNVRRDAQVAAALRMAGWRVWTVWGCQLKRSTELLVRKLEMSRTRQRAASRSRSTEVAR
ncbi:DNA mismatch endonuclease Vsr [Skermanella sp. TT6]|uniref:Very short patch repair endonuclease n=2 Tax=Skermanella cutis TaxID=2775420 RepID=A0ABX7B684_9PROT|nr:DNA mismatch endonuclease Vsr [Skermanella sp. TT6]